MTQEEKELIRKFCENNLSTHTDWTGTYVETRYKCESVDDFVNKLLNYIEERASDEVLKIRQAVYQSGYNDGYKHGIEDVKKHKFIIGDIISNNNAIFRVDNIVKNCIGQDCYFLVNVEREKDGTRYLKLIDSNGKTHNSGEITWICEQVDAKFEKQDEKKPADKTEPKFKVGDWVVNKFGDSWHIDSFDKKNYQVSDVKGNYNYFPIAKQDEMHLWTIKDAKDGDVLQLGEVTAIFKEFIGNEHCRCYCSVYEGEFEIPSQNGDDNSYGCYNATPATKEQRDTLFAKMKEAGFEWDDKNKILRRFIRTIKQNDENAPSIWSDEDEYMLNETIQHLEELIRIDKAKYCACDVQYYQRDIDWLKSIKERIASMNVYCFIKEKC